ncbi:MAG: HAD family hydrolase [Stygiobacter sp.]
MIKNIFFDYDGVISDSVNVKTDAFYKMFLQHGEEIAKKVKQHHLENGGMSRFKKFSYYYKEFLKIEIDEIKVIQLAEEFSRLVLEGVINSPLIKGVYEFLSENYKTMNFWIISGTPTEEINLIIKRKNIDNFFKGAYGSPENKIYWSDFLTKKFNLNKTETIFIGDALADYEAAKENGLRFVLREDTENIRLFEQIDDIALRIKDFIDFNSKLNLL